MQWIRTVEEELGRILTTAWGDPVAIERDVARSMKELVTRFERELLDFPLELNEVGNYCRQVLGRTRQGCEVLVVGRYHDRMTPHNHRNERGAGLSWSLIVPVVGGARVRNEVFRLEEHVDGRRLVLTETAHAERAEYGHSHLFMDEGGGAPIHRLVRVGPREIEFRTLHLYDSNTDGSDFFSDIPIVVE